MPQTRRSGWPNLQPNADLPIWGKIEPGKIQTDVGAEIRRSDLIRVRRIVMRILSFLMLPGFFALAGLVAAPALTLADESIRLQETFPRGYQYHVSTRVELSVSMSLPDEKGQGAARVLAVTGTSAIEYDERILDTPADGQVQKTLRIFRRIDLQRRVGDRPQESTIRPAVRRMVVLRLKQAEVPFSPDGPLTWGEIDLVRTDVFTPGLAGLPPD